MRRARNPGATGWCGGVLVLLGSTGSAAASVPFIADIPNGSCVSCHTTEPELDSFGVAVMQQRTLNDGGINWPGLFAVDTDLDGFTNGEELGDPCGVWVPGAVPAYGNGIADPGNQASVPVAHTVDTCVTSSSSAPSTSEDPQIFSTTTSADLPSSSTASSSDPPSSSADPPSSSTRISSSATSLEVASSFTASSSTPSSGFTTSWEPTPSTGSSTDGATSGTATSTTTDGGVPSVSSSKPAPRKSKGDDDNPLNPLGGCTAARGVMVPLLVLFMIMLAALRRGSTRQG